MSSVVPTPFPVGSPSPAFLRNASLSGVGFLFAGSCGEITKPGITALTRTFVCAKSRASPFASAFTAPFSAPPTYWPKYPASAFSRIINQNNISATDCTVGLRFEAESTGRYCVGASGVDDVVLCNSYQVQKNVREFGLQFI